MVGSGTSVEVAKDMGIEAHALDFLSGFDVLKNSILEPTVLFERARSQYGTE